MLSILESRGLRFLSPKPVYGDDPWQANEDVPHLPPFCNTAALQTVGVSSRQFLSRVKFMVSFIPLWSYFLLGLLVLLHYL
ncbi:hypothetical protein CJF30_00001592 [Rutstroemia sp. NJR-2017a BBW]|nr:hypothetical protein CJF30_00001592 [Rutstroemia sp. NJR-2017a BBW]